jgi:hypothetical protein
MAMTPRPNLHCCCGLMVFEFDELMVVEEVENMFQHIQSPLNGRRG